MIVLNSDSRLHEDVRIAWHISELLSFKNPATAVIVNQVLVTKQQPQLIARRFTYSVCCVWC